MNKNLKILIASVLMITTIGLVGCGGKGDKPTADNNPQVTEDENKTETEDEDKDKDNETDKEEDDDKEDKEDDKNNNSSSKPEEKPQTKPEEKPQVKPEEKPQTKPEEKPEVKPEQKEHSYTVYYMDSTASFLEKKTKKGDKEEILKPWSVLWQLQEVGPLNKNVKVNSFTVNNENIAVIDLSKEMYDTKLGSGPESLMIESMAKTFMSAYETDGLIIKVDGKLYSSGHIILEEGKYFK